MHSSLSEMAALTPFWSGSIYIIFHTTEAQGPHASVCLAHCVGTRVLFLPWTDAGYPHREVGSLWLVCSLLPVGADLSSATHIPRYDSIRSKHMEKAEAPLCCQSWLYCQALTSSESPAPGHKEKLPHTKTTQILKYVCLKRTTSCDEYNNHLTMLFKNLGCVFLWIKA